MRLQSSVLDQVLLKAYRSRMTDAYSILGVAPTASQKEIRKAFRQKARSFHPDKLPPGTSDAVRKTTEEKFKVLAGAYEVIADEDKRATYPLPQK